MDKLKAMLLSKEFIIFIVIGCINTLSGAGFSIIYSMLLNDIASFILGYATGIIVSYVLNSTFTFKEKLSAHKLIKFAISTIPNFLIQLTTVYIIVTVLGMHKFIAYAVAAMIGVPATFLIVKCFVFIKKS